MGTAIVATRAASTISGIQLQVSGELMDDYVFATDLREQSDIRTVRGADGRIHLFYLGRSGAMCLFQDPASDTGWTEETLGQPESGLTAIQAAAAGDGTLFAFAIGINQSEPDLHVASKVPGGAWTGWSPIPAAQNVPDFVRTASMAAITVAGEPSLFALLRPTPGHRGNPALWRIDWRARPAVWTRIAASDSRILEACTIAGAGPGLLFADRSDSDPNGFDLYHLPAPFTGTPSRLAAAVSYTSLAVGVASGGHSVIAVADNGYISGNRAISVLDCEDPAGGFRTVDRTIAASGLAVIDAGATPMGIFALDERGQLNLIDGDGASGWRPAFNLQLPCAGIVAISDSQGQGELFAWLQGKGLHRKWRSPRPPGDDTPGYGPWSEEPVLYEALNSELVRRKTYATTIVVSDGNGARMPDCEVSLRASEIVAATVAGRVVLLGPDRDLTVRTDAAARIRLTAPADSLRTCEFSVTLPGLMSAGEDFKIQPNSKVQARVAAISDEDLKKFLKPEFAPDAGEIRKAIEAAMTPMKPIDGYRTVRHRPAGWHGHRTPIDTSAMQAFRLDIGPGGAKFTPLSRADAATASAAIVAEHGEMWGILQFFEDVIDALDHAVEQAIEVVGHYIVEPIANAIQITLKFAVESIHYAAQVVIDAVEQAFQVVDSIFEVVATAFDAVYDFFAWLLQDAAKDIWKTKDLFKDRLRTGVSDLAKLARQASVGPGFFASIAAAVDQAFSDSKVTSRLGGVDFDTALRARPDGPALAGGGGESFMDIMDGVDAAATWLIDKIEEALWGAAVPFSLPPGILADFAASSPTWRRPSAMPSARRSTVSSPPWIRWRATASASRRWRLRLSPRRPDGRSCSCLRCSTRWSRSS